MGEARVVKIIDTHINPKLQEHGGRIELADYEDDVLFVRFRGACVGCGYIQETMDKLVIPIFKAHAPEIKEIRLDEGISQELYDLALSMLSKQ